MADRTPLPSIDQQFENLIQMYASLQQQVSNLRAPDEARILALEARVKLLEEETKTLRGRIVRHDQQIHQFPAQGWS